MTNVAGAENVLGKVYQYTGYDGVVYANDRGTHEFVALTSNQFKSADPVTYDDNGNVIPLSKRFDENQEDIRYSRKRTVASGKKKSYNKNSYYHEFDSFAMQWRYKADTEVGDLNIINGKGGFALLEATEDGYVEIAKGSWLEMKELKAEYERAHKETNETLHNYSEEYGVDRGTDTWDMFDDEDRRYGLGNNTDLEKRRLQTDSERSNEYRRLGDKEKLIKSISREPSISEEASDYILDTKEYKEILEIVDQRFEATGHKELSPKAIDRLAGKLLTKSKSNYSREQLTERLTALFDYIANSQDLEWSEVTTFAVNIYDNMIKVIIDQYYILCYTNYSSPTQRFSE